MAAVTTENMLSRYRGFIFGCLTDPHGGWTRPYEAIFAQANEEFAQLTPNFQGRLYALITASQTLSTALKDAAEDLKHEYNAACSMWNTLPMPIQQQQRQFIILKRDGLLQASMMMENHWAVIIQECNAENTSQGPRVHAQFALPLNMSWFIECVTDRLTEDRTERISVQLRNNGYRNPSQVVPMGEKILGRHNIPRALMEAWGRQVYPPMPSEANFGYLTDDQLLPQVPNCFWHGVALGAGGMGSTKVYTLTNLAGVVVNHLVIKDANPAPTLSKFRSARTWHGDLSRNSWQVSCTPLEYHTQKIVSENEEMRSVVKVLGPPIVDWQKFSYRILMEYAPHGDLKQVIKRHKAHREPIPEKFIWMCFRGLIRACMVMQQGGISETKVPWSEIVHCDLKPENVFLGPPRAGYYPQWPTALLGDFGLAFVTSAHDPTNPFLWSLSGTKGHFAPEQMQYINELTGTPADAVKMLSPCNVYGMGPIIFSMMEQRTLSNHVQPSFLPGTDPKDYAVHPYFKQFYSRLLWTTVDQCLQTNPALRPTVLQLMTALDGLLMSQKFASDRGGVLGPNDDTLLLPNDPVRLRWASRMDNRGPGPRIPRVPGGTSTQYGG